MDMISGPMPVHPSDDTVKAWVSLVRAHTRVLSKIQDALKTAGCPPLEWYDALLELNRVGDEGLRPFELEKHLLLPQYGLSRLLTRLEKEGLVSRDPVDGDKRGFIARITPKGREVGAKMWPVYSSVLEHEIGERLTEEEAALVIQALKKLG